MESLKAIYTDAGLTYTIEVACDENLPYDLGELFSQILKASNANPQMVIQDLLDTWGFNVTIPDE